MAGKREPETEYSEKEKSIEEIRNLRKEKMEARKKAERKSKSKEIVLSLLFVCICVGAVLGISAAVKRPEPEKATTEKSSYTMETVAKSSVEKEASSKEDAETTEETEASRTEAPTETEPETTTEEVTEIASTETLTESSLETYEASITTTAAPTVENPNLQGDVYIPSWVTQDFLNISEYNRPGIPLPEVKNVVVHYVGNPGSTAKDNRDFFEDLATTHERSASSHFIVGLQGEILQCVPLWEVAYANYPRNFDTISIEVCHPDETGKYNDTTYWSVVMLASYLLEQYSLTSEDLIRHYDCNGKFCPLYYVEHPDAWQQLRDDVKYYMAAHPDMRHEIP